MKTQSELVRALRAQLSATERSLEEQRWVFEQVLQSPSWRITTPIRWAAHQLRKLRKESVRRSAPAHREEIGTPEPDIQESVDTLDAAASTLFQISFENFLQSGALLELPHSTEPEVSIVLVSGNRPSLMLACLRSIGESQRESIEVVIVDNASSEETRQLLLRLRGAQVIVNTSACSSYEAARQAAQRCKGLYLLFLSSTVQLQPGTLRSALRTIKSSSRIGVVGGRIILADGTLEEAGRIVWPDGSWTAYGRRDDPFAPTFSFRRDVDSCSATFLLTPRMTFEELIGSHSNCLSSDWDGAYCADVWRDGLRVVYEPEAAVVHYELSHADRDNEPHPLSGSPPAEPQNSEALLRARSRNAEHRVLVIDDRVPHEWLGSGFPRANELQRVLLNQGCFVTLYPLAVLHEPWDQAYADFPHEIEIMMGRDLMESFLRARKNYYSTIIISRLHNMRWMATFLKEHPDWFENSTVVYDAEAIVARREIGQRELAGNPMTSEEIENLIRSEVELTTLADCVITVSERERRVFQSYGVERVEVLGHRLQPDPGTDPFETREGLLFVGAVHDDLCPNADSLVWFLQEILPRIRQRLGDIPVTLAGLNRSERIREMVKPPVRITGQLPSLESFYREARVFIAPTRFAGGIPLKILEAAAKGLPVVATGLLAEQLNWTDREAAIAIDAEGFAARCVEVYTDAAKWTSLREGALERICKEYAPEVFEESVRAILDSRRQARVAVH